MLQNNIWFCYGLMNEQCRKIIFDLVLLYLNAIRKPVIYSFLGILSVYEFIKYSSKILFDFFP
ncbi:MAG: hypothetical protein EBX50_19215 [Chitinophagia bacterium]|nr:hypothetical protein [Chitinophagia bacterium]